MKNMNKIFYDILLKINKSENDFEINKNLVLKYFEYLKDSNFVKYKLFAQYFTKFYHFCFELNPKTMIKDAIKFRYYIMAVPKRKTSISRKKMRRSHHKLSSVNILEDKKSGEYKLSHHIDLKSGYYNGKKY